MLAYGWWMNHFPARPDRFFYRSIHADIGYMLLVSMVLRIVWRWINPVPAMPAGTTPLQRVVARINHGALYLATFVVIMLGWAHSGARPQGDYGSFFGLFHVPQFTSPDKATADAFEDRHIYAAYVLLALIVIHLGAAAWHHYIKRDRVAARMVDGKAG
jgi:cytochrome b561